jgi:hypothetical protein
MAKPKQKPGEDASIPEQLLPCLTALVEQISFHFPNAFLAQPSPWYDPTQRRECANTENRQL